MHVKSKRRRGRSSAFGLALVAMLTTGAFLASAAQADEAVWHLSGETLAERGLTREGFVLDGGTVSVKVPYFPNAEVSCTEVWGWGYVEYERDGTAHITAEGCTVPYQGSHCYVDPLEMDFSLEVDGIESAVSEHFEPERWGNLATLTVHGLKCSWPYEEEELWWNGEPGSGSSYLSASVGTEGDPLTVTGDPSHVIPVSYGGHLAEVSFSGISYESTPAGWKLGAW